MPAGPGVGHCRPKLPRRPVLSGKKRLAKGRFPPIIATLRLRHGQTGPLSARGESPHSFFQLWLHGAPMEDHLAEELVNIMKKNTASDYEEAFERAFELTKAYAGSANAQASAIPFVFEKVFELFVSGRTKS